VLGMPLRMPMRQSSATESGTESQDQGLVSADQSALRGLWFEQNHYGIYPRGPGMTNLSSIYVL